MLEVWKDIEGYKERYQISNYGRVYSKKHKKTMVGRDNKGYSIINLRKDGKTKTVSIHRLVADAFIENKHCKREVNHIDENKKNNNVSNLEWVTPKENINHGTLTQRLSKKVVQIDKNTNKAIKKYNSIGNASEKTGLWESEISRCCKGKAETTGGYKWMYIEDYQALL